MEAYGTKIRELIIDAYEEGKEAKEIARIFKVSVPWVRKVRQRWLKFGIKSPIKQKHGPDPKLDASRRQRLAELVKQTPDSTLDELRKKLDVPVSIATVHRALDDMRLTLKKKSIRASEQDRPDVKRKREDWAECLPGLDLDKLVFLDECGINLLMTRLFGRCPRGERLVTSMPDGRWQNYTLLSAVRLSGALAPMLVDGPINGDSFATWVEEHLVPELEFGDMVIMDNLPAHKSTRVEQAIANAGCTTVYLPPYSPDFNPIENVWSKVKAMLRQACARTLDTLVDAVKSALLAVTPEDCEGYFEHCGYGDTAT